MGREPGPAKMEKARNYNIPMISEDELLDMILVKSGMKPKYVAKQNGETLENEDSPAKKNAEEKLSKETFSKDLKKDSKDSKKDSKESKKNLKEKEEEKGKSDFEEVPFKKQKVEVKSEDKGESPKKLEKNSEKLSLKKSSEKTDKSTVSKSDKDHSKKTPEKSDKASDKHHSIKSEKHHTNKSEKDRSKKSEYDQAKKSEYDHGKKSEKDHVKRSEKDQAKRSEKDHAKKSEKDHAKRSEKDQTKKSEDQSKKSENDNLKKSEKDLLKKSEKHQHKSSEKSPKKEHPKLTQSKDLPSFEKPKVEISSDSLAWTEKYKPTNIKAIIGQQTDSSNMKKLLSWLKNWHNNHSPKNKNNLKRPSPWAKNDDGSFFKCALLSGPPGVGKTTTATLVAKELGFDVVEFNASDTRSKRLLHEEVATLLSTTSLAKFFVDGSAPTKQHVLLMDEVDGMAGNEDRGGMQELINLIKNTNVPIICMCNDRNHQKVRSLANYCFDLRFARPRMEQIRGAMMSVCYREGIKITPDALSQVITGAGMDIRQTLNHLSVWTASDKNLSAEKAQKEAESAKKDVVLGPWEVCRKVFSEEDHKTMSLGDKSRLFFHDYSLAPLFVQENYLSVIPRKSKSESDRLKCVADAAEALSMSDVIDKKIRSSNNWSLLESQSMFASVLPGFYMEGHMGGQINFPSWLGQNSKRGKFQRLLCELQSHMRTSISGTRQAVNLDYNYHIRNRIIEPLAKEGTAGVDKALSVLKTYNLTREDFDSLVELCQWSDIGKPDPMSSIESKVKAAFTRCYNKEGQKLPYSLSNVTIKKKTASSANNEEGYDDEEEDQGSASDNDDISKDAMIKEAKKPTARSKKDAGESSGRGAKASGRGRGKKAK